MSRPFKTVDLTKIKTVRLATRKSLASAGKMGKIPSPAKAETFFESLPGFLKANDLKALIKAILSARRRSKPVILMAGGHLIKVGLNAIIIDLLERDLITGICFNGSGIIHDSEIALVGETSEDVVAGIADGSFGMSAETASHYAEIVELAKLEKIGLGQAAGAVLEKKKAKFRKKSLLAACYRLNKPAMVHIAVDTDIVCQHPNYDAGAAAEASHHDFKLLAEVISQGENGGVFLNIGSAVILPEVFLKALTVSRNLYGKPKKIITANFDMIQHYRPSTNVVQRPTRHGGTGYSFTGHHEIMIPLLAWGLKGYLNSSRSGKSRTAKKRSK